MILPGVGAFRDAITYLKERELVTTIHQFIASTKPVLGICLGMQLLQTTSFEDGEWPGLDVMKGEVKRFPDMGLRIPHIGWNTLKKKGIKEELLDNIPDESYFYFVHSYYVESGENDRISAVTEYGIEFSSVLHKDNLWGVQFHPEKSQKIGLQLLENFCKFL